VPDDLGPAPSRREFLGNLGGGVGAALLATLWSPALDAAEQVKSGGQQPRFRVLTAQQAADLAAIADRIIPRDDTPCASEVGLVFFADQYLATIGAHDNADFEKALVEANAAAKKQVRTAASFANLTEKQQDAVLRSIENTDGFGFLRAMTVSGYLCHPMHGGNRGHAGWKAIGFEERMSWSPPFGYYDRPEVATRLTPRRPS